MVYGIEAIDWKLIFLKARYDGTGGHTMKLKKNGMRLDISKYLFPQKEIDFYGWAE